MPGILLALAPTDLDAARLSFHTGGLATLNLVLALVCLVLGSVVPYARARAEGLGMGWVSIFDPGRLAELLGMPDGADPIAVLCLGEVPEFPDRPQLEIDHWATARPLSEFVFENGWG